jgi:hypothetical protein
LGDQAVFSERAVSGREQAGAAPRLADAAAPPQLAGTVLACVPELRVQNIKEQREWAS